jgi:tetratricopeptide (TPR) repeat protein
MGSGANPTQAMKQRGGLFSRKLAPVWLGLVALAVALRMYHLPGFVVSNDEGHWLIYALDKRLLFEPLRNSYPRPDIFFPLLVSVPIKLFGPNELALRLLPVLIGSLTLLPLANLVFQIMGDRRAAVFAAAFLAVLPLHVYFSAQGVPDAIALFFGLYALVYFMRGSFIWMSVWFALALLTKATTLYCLGFVAVAGSFFLVEQRQQRTFRTALSLSVVPFALVTLIIFLRSRTLTFFREPGITDLFGLSFDRLWLHLRYFLGFYDVLLLVALIGAVVVVFRAKRGAAADRQLLIWLFPLVNLIVTPFFRAGRLELLWLIPTLCLFAAVGLSSLRASLAWSAAALVTVMLLARSVFGTLLPYPGRGKADSDYTTAVLARPAGWPSRDGARWLMEHTSPEDAIIITAYTFTDPLLLDLERLRRVISNGGDNWGLLRDPTNRVKYVVFTQDYRAYASSLAKYADTHFTQPAEALFPGYAIYDCQKDGKWVAHPDAYSSGGQYVREGMEFFQQHQMERAVEAFQKALEVDPNQPVASANLCVLYFQLYREAEGVAQCERNIRLGIVPAISYGVLGQFRERQGDVAGAQVAYEKSLAFDPQNAVTRQLLADLRERVGARQK